MSEAKKTMKDSILKNGVDNLQEFGYPNVTTETIITDSVYREFFRPMLNDNLGQGNELSDEVIQELLDEIDNQ